MENYHDFLEHRSYKHIKRKRTKSGKYRYWYPPKNIKSKKTSFLDKISEKLPSITVVSKGDEIEGVAVNGKMFIDNLLDKTPSITIVSDGEKKGVAVNGKMFIDNLLDIMPSITIVSDGKTKKSPLMAD